MFLLAAPYELKDMPIPQAQQNLTTDESRMYVEGKRENTRRRITTKTSMEESQMDDEGEER